jgi:heme o synthase
MLRTYLSLTKPGIILGNLLTTAAGYFIGSFGNPAISELLVTLLASALVMASGCVLNNYIDRDIDAKMERTKNRALASGVVRPHLTLVFAFMLGASGLAIFAIWTNMTATLSVIFGLFSYAVLYSMWWKRRSVFGTEIGSIAGAMPPVIGYTAATNTLDVGALLLFLILVTWQMPHFYAIGLRRLDDYRAAGVPILPVVSGPHATKVRILIWIAAFTLVAPLLWVYEYAGGAYLLISLVLGMAWFGIGLFGLRFENDTRFATRMFYVSILVLFLLSFTMMLDATQLAGIQLPYA